MLKMNEVLKASKGLYVDDSFAMLWGKQLGGWKIAELTGTLPMIFRADGSALINYRIFGTADGAGVQTENLFDPTATDTSKGYANNSVIYTNGNVEGSSALWCVSEYLDIKDCTNLLLRMTSDRTGTVLFPAIVFYDSSKARISGKPYNAQQANNIIIEFKIPNGANFVRFSAFKGENTTVELLKNITQQTAPSTYIPYGNKLPLTLTSGTKSKDTDIFIGDSKLLSGDYVDYEEQKVYKRTENDFPFAKKGTFAFGNDGKIVSDGEGKFVLSVPSSANNVRSELIPLNRQYTIPQSVDVGGEFAFYLGNNIINSQLFLRFYDTNGVQIDEWACTSVWRKVTEYTVMAGKTIAYICFACGSSSGALGETQLTPMFSKNVNLTSYIPYLQPTDPPLPFPELKTYKGTNTLDSTEALGEVTIKGKIKEAE